MSAVLVDGRTLAAQLRGDIVTKVEAFRKQFGLAPTLAVVRVGDEPASILYARQIDKAFTDGGMGYQLHVLPPNAAQGDTQILLDRLERDPEVNGVMLQRPLPNGIDGEKLMTHFPVLKDVEGVSPTNIGRLMQRRGEYFPTSTPSAALEILKHYQVPLEGKHAVIVGRSNILGRPMALLLLHENATVTICHSFTNELQRIVSEADIVIAAAGKSHLITGKMIKPGSTVIDFGVNMVNGGIVGDVDLDSVVPVAGLVTPVPGGTGPVTTVMLMRNTLTAAVAQSK